MQCYVTYITFFAIIFFSRNGDGCVEPVQEWETFSVPNECVGFGNQNSGRRLVIHGLSP